jgi:hypothetical protein
LERQGTHPAVRAFTRLEEGTMPVRAITRFLVGFVLAILAMVWGEWMLDFEYVLSPQGWIVAAGIGGLFAAIPRLWGGE